MTDYEKNRARRIFAQERKEFWAHLDTYFRSGLIAYQWEQAKREALIRTQWENLNGETVDETGEVEDDCLVRLRIVPDDLCHIDDLAGDTFDPDANPDIPRDRLKRERQQFIERVNREGVWGVVGEYLDPATGEWEFADSCFGFVGDDWIDCGYDLDIMSSTIDARLEAEENPGSYQRVFSQLLTASR